MGEKCPRRREETQKVKVPNPVRNFKLKQFVLSAFRVFIIPLVGIFVIPGEKRKGRKDETFETRVTTSTFL